MNLVTPWSAITSQEGAAIRRSKVLGMPAISAIIAYQSILHSHTFDRLEGVARYDAQPDVPRCAWRNSLGRRWWLVPEGDEQP